MYCRMIFQKKKLDRTCHPVFIRTTRTTKINQGSITTVLNERWNLNRNHWFSSVYPSLYIRSLDTSGILDRCMREVSSNEALTIPSFLKRKQFSSVEAIQLSNYTGPTVTGYQPTAFPGESKNSFPRMRRHRISVEKAASRETKLAETR